MAWRNSDNTTHHMVLDDGSVDTGTLAPGTVSQPFGIGGGTRTYHCTIHRSMVGSINGSAAPAPPPCPDPYGYGC